MFNPVFVRETLRCAIAELSLDAPAFRAFYAGFIYRSSIATTGEGCPNWSVSQRLVEAFAFALSRRWRDLASVIVDVQDLAPAPAWFKYQALVAIDGIREVELRALDRTLRAVAQTGVAKSVVEGVLFAYYQERFSGLNPDPW